MSQENVPSGFKNRFKIILRMDISNRPQLVRQRTLALIDTTTSNVARLVELDLQQWNETFISQSLDNATSQLKSQKDPWYKLFKTKLTFKRLTNALSAGLLRRRIDLLNEISPTSQRWNNDNLQLHLNSDAIYFQLNEQMTWIQQLGPGPPSSYQSLGQSFDQLSHLSDDSIIREIEHGLMKEKHFQRQKFCREITRLVYSLRTSLTPCVDQVDGIKGQMVSYLISHYNISESLSQSFAHTYITARIGVLSKTTSNNQD